MRKKIALFTSLLLIVCFGFVFGACNEIPKNYNVNVNVWYANYGIVYGGGTFEEDTTCQIYATPKQNSTFLAWMHDDVIVSYDAEYNFKVTNETSGTYTAIFTCPNLELVTPKSIIFTDQYQDNTITAIDFNLKMGSSYDNLHEVFSGDVLNANEFNIEDIVLALNSKAKILCEANLTYSYETNIDNEVIETNVTTKTRLEFTLTELVTENLKLNIPAGIDGEAYIQIVFDNFKGKELTEDNDAE